MDPLAQRLNFADERSASKCRAHLQAGPPMKGTTVIDPRYSERLLREMNERHRESVIGGTRQLPPDCAGRAIDLWA